MNKNYTLYLNIELMDRLGKHATMMGSSRSKLIRKLIKKFDSEVKGYIEEYPEMRDHEIYSEIRYNLKKR